MSEDLIDPIKPRLFTSGRQDAVWRVAKEYGFKRLDDFWGYARREGWDYYDVLQIASPTD